MRRTPLATALLFAGLAGLGDVPAAAAPGGGSITGQVVTVAGGKAIAADEVYVYLSDEAPRRRGRHGAATAGATARIRQVKQQFEPHVLVVPIGTTVYFPNNDSQEHNVFSPTDPPGQWDLGRYDTDAIGHPHVFRDAHEVDIFCDIHKEMWAKVKVVDAVQIARVKDGHFRLDGVPAGTYRLTAWAPGSVEVHSRQLVVEDGQALELPADELHLQITPWRPGPHLRKDRRPYCADGYTDC
jgi:plastocyanin